MTDSLTVRIASVRRPEGYARGPGAIAELRIPGVHIRERLRPPTLVEDALRTNDPRLVAAAMGGYAARRLPDSPWRHGVLKCLFMEVPLDAVAGWERRADAELTRMTRAFVAERAAAGRAIPDDAIRLTERNAD